MQELNAANVFSPIKNKLELNIILLLILFIIITDKILYNLCYYVVTCSTLNQIISI